MSRRSLNLRSFSLRSLSLSLRTRGALVLAVQLALALSVAARFAWERHTCPMVWTRASQYDPELAVRGRYLALRLQADACGLPNGLLTNDYGWNAAHEWSTIQVHSWDVTLVAQNGKLAGKVANARRPGETQTLTLRREAPCAEAVLEGETTNFYIAEHARPPLPLARGQQLWALVTVPPSGPPRPVRLAISDSAGFHLLDAR